MPNMLSKADFRVLLRRCSGTILSLVLLSSPTVVLADPGHGNDFNNSSETNPDNSSINIDPETAKRLQVKTEPAKRQRLAVRITTTGQIETLPNKQVEVTAPIAGTVVELLVKPGDSVTFGQPVAVVSSPELVELRVSSLEKQAQAEAELRQAQANLNAAQKNYSRVKEIFEVSPQSVLVVKKENYNRQQQIADAEIASTQIEIDVAREQYEKDKTLAERGAIPKRQMRESQAKFAQIQTQLTRANSRPELLQADSELKQAQLDYRRELIEAENQLKVAQSDVEAAKEQLRLSQATYQRRVQQLKTPASEQGLVTVLAPISGRISDREVTLGESFQDAGGKLMTIVNDSRVWIRANIYEKDLDKIRTGQIVSAIVANLPNRRFTGRISFIGSVVEENNRVVPVKAELDNSTQLLKPGQFVNLEVSTDQISSDILAIPVSAVVNSRGKNLVYVENGDAYQGVEVTLGETFGDMVEVKSGLFEGDIIVTQRAPQLYAQSLRGGGSSQKEEDSTSHTMDNTETNADNTPVNLPLWLMIATGGLLTLGIFGAGTFYGRRQQIHLAVENALQNNSHSAAPNSYLDKTKFLKTTDDEISETDDKL